MKYCGKSTIVALKIAVKRITVGKLSWRILQLEVTVLMGATYTMMVIPSGQTTFSVLTAQLRTVATAWIFDDQWNYWMDNPCMCLLTSKYRRNTWRDAKNEADDKRQGCSVWNLWSVQFRAICMYHSISELHKVMRLLQQQLNIASWNQQLVSPTPNCPYTVSIRVTYYPWLEQLRPEYIKLIEMYVALSKGVNEYRWPECANFDLSSRLYNPPNFIYKWIEHFCNH